MDNWGRAAGKITLIAGDKIGYFGRCRCHSLHCVLKIIPIQDQRGLDGILIYSSHAKNSEDIAQRYLRLWQSQMAA